MNSLTPENLPAFVPSLLARRLSGAEQDGDIIAASLRGREGWGVSKAPSVVITWAGARAASLHI